MPYKEYIGKNCKPHPHWLKVRAARYEFDNHCCVYCRAVLDEKSYQTHHLTYDRLGHEHMRDVITLCNECHIKFHENWKYAEFWDEQDEDHWSEFSLEHTAKLCSQYLTQDYWFGGELNCCAQDTCRDLIDQYFIDNDPVTPAIINPDDIVLYFRNKRYEVLFAWESAGIELNKSTDERAEKLLDERFGPKGRKGGNQKRSNARAFMIKHDSESYHRNYSQLKYLNELMEETRKYE